MGRAELLMQVELARTAGLPDKARRAADLALAALKAAAAQEADLLLRVQDADRARCAPAALHGHSFKHRLSERLAISAGILTVHLY